jgi:hypothetical protein
MGSSFTNSMGDVQRAHYLIILSAHEKAAMKAARSDGSNCREKLIQFPNMIRDPSGHRRSDSRMSSYINPCENDLARYRRHVLYCCWHESFPQSGVLRTNRSAKFPVTACAGIDQRRGGDHRRRGATYLFVRCVERRPGV